MKQNILLYGHLCIDKNEIAGKKVAENPGSPVYFGARILRNFGFNPTIISLRGNDYADTWLNGIEVFPQQPIGEKTLVYKNVYDVDGKRTLFAENVDCAILPEPNTIPQTLISQANAVIVAPIVNNVQIDYIRALREKSGEETLFVALPQGFFRRFTRQHFENNADAGFQKNGEVHQDLWQEAEEFAQYFDIICLSEEDGKDIDTQAFTWSQSKSIVVVTRAEAGCSIYEKGARTDFPAFEIETIVDPVGAGDVFAAAFVYSYLKDAKVENGAVFANAAGALSLKCHPQDMRFGTTDIEKFLKTSPLKPWA